MEYNFHQTVPLAWAGGVSSIACIHRELCHVTSTKYVSRVTCHVLRDGRTKGHTHITLGDRGEDGDYDCVTRQQCSVTLTRGCNMLCARDGDQRPVTRYTVCHPYTGLWYHHCIAKSPLCILSLIFFGIFFLLFFLFLLFHFQ